MVLGGIIILTSIIMTEVKLPKKKGKRAVEAQMLFDETEK